MIVQGSGDSLLAGPLETTRIFARALEAVAERIRHRGLESGIRLTDSDVTVTLQFTRADKDE